jgi:hypothetical protein
MLLFANAFIQTDLFQHEAGAEKFYFISIFVATVNFFGVHIFAALQQSIFSRKLVHIVY